MRDENAASATRLVDPLTLLTPRRLDLAAKTLFLKHASNGTLAWGAEQVYREHLRAWGMGKIHEYDGSKTGYTSFHQSFLALRDSLQQSGYLEDYEPVPATSAGTIVDGAHRTACAIHLGLSLPLCSVDTEDPDYGMDFFLKRGMPESLVDQMLLEYLTLRTDVRVAVLFPIFDDPLGHFESQASAFEGIDIVAVKQVALSRTGVANLLHLMYEDEPWMEAGSVRSAGIQQHLSNRFVPGKPVQVVFFQCQGSDEQIVSTTVALKERIRAIADKGNYPLHINDYYPDTLKIGRQLLHPGSRRFMDVADTFKARQFRALLKQFKRSHDLSELERCAVTSGGVMAIHGLRDSKDLDLLMVEPQETSQEQDCHNRYLDLYGLPLERLLCDPDCYFWFAGTKFVTLAVVKQMKANRGGAKDSIDLDLIALFESKQRQRGRTRQWLDELLVGVRYLPIRLIGLIGVERLTRVVRRLFPGRVYRMVRDQYRKRLK